jgi:hypothetical protein
LLSESASGNGERVASDHLDADELNSYAEGVAPVAARTRYAEHLADCHACRGIVVGLTQAAGAANRYDVQEQQRGLSFWQRLATLFSPPVLRYAVPVLVLTAVIGIGLLALRQQQQTEFVARNAPEATAPATQGETAAANNPTPAPQSTIQNGIQSETRNESTKDGTVLQREKSQQGEPSSVTPAFGAGKAAPAKDSAPPADAASVAQSRPYALEPKTAATPPPPVPYTSAEKSAELAKEQPAKREDQPRERDEELRAQADDVHGPNRSRSNAAPAASQRGALGGRGPSGMDKKKASEVETRTVMGKQFIREGDAWVDSAYESSRATVRVVRGSDQFRALVADEPGIRTIAGQLNGVVIVVWKGRAYRIQ